MNDFHLPAPEAFEELVRKQKLDDLQAYELWLVLYHANEDMKEHRKRLEGRKPRPELVRRFKRTAKVLNDLEYELDRWWKTMTDFLPLDTLEEIGLLMSFTAMEAALKREICSRDPESDIESLVGDDPDFRIGQIADQSDFRIAQIEERVGF